MRKKVELVLMLLLLAALLHAAKYLKSSVSSEKVEAGGSVIVVDCGHGGEDPGLVGVLDALEQERQRK